MSKEETLVPESGIFRRIDDDLVLAREHVRRGREIVTAQEHLVERQRALHFDTTDAERTLGIFIGTLKIFEDHYSLLAKKAVPSS